MWRQAGTLGLARAQHVRIGNKALCFLCRSRPNPGSAPGPSQLRPPEVSCRDREAGARGLHQGAGGGRLVSSVRTPIWTQGPGGQDCELADEMALSEPGPHGRALQPGGAAQWAAVQVQGPDGA